MQHTTRWNCPCFFADSQKVSKNFTYRFLRIPKPSVGYKNV
uniref:Uncharacterized protein n=1 Tax=Rhizophora mucronata TaxID=61149 RepID=A0A2P2NKI4_RHIMU